MFSANYLTPPGAEPDPDDALADALVEVSELGRNMLSGVAEGVGNLFRGKGGEDRQQLASMLSVYSDFAIGDVTSRFSIAEDGLPGMMSTAQQVFFKWNGMTWWTERQR